MPSHLLYWIATIVFALAAVPYPAPNAPLNLLALGLVFFTLAHMYPGG